METKTYRQKFVKFILSYTFSLIFSVAILLYLFSIRNFLPLNEIGDFNWLNILVFTFLLSILIDSIITILIYLFLLFILKKEGSRELEILSIKWGILFTLGIQLVVLLNFFHILNLYWGFGILSIVIILLFII
ncbi:MAG: hypothetical protein UR34_C0004G0004 [candidate division WS6 bacterium GW2011_GWC1_33_20]|uniref:Uncharacterized protein n=2 Tax=Candidatus Dojkabacteria TaxID=74243 RepID=A0A0G0AFH0_9BACT|nr:MAG: hypothetical protein UR32_C0001G0027 [candidate division WS6 bacterium GW2011_GWE2_33_157]KKP44263.1 MAG: hypothetical protein UR34_C0004G0004 [candidate division WS6 bacterium GW2011_GWC1_33_20]KKP45872.1 MAG: hypothetical protein UR36_C0003G0027 [candidate division WS6 bacterium GW2011_GWF1_33_233]KKP55131.1 MAG: hypothetical protein UR45_C0004G0026 [candidate division WS6 bacterium GW2011_WS6_33_547]KKP55333.1 MAG: hypothetical protein UR47_C0002G0050 [candidate division WS6 bacteriu